jgi:HD-GYP domain-containing protein (c-di-GMP phosphodiesterase class II)
MVNDRPYRVRRSDGEAIRILTSGAGKQWDRQVVQVFVESLRPTT